MFCRTYCTKNAPDISEIWRICPTEGGFREDLCYGYPWVREPGIKDIWYTWLSTTSLNTIGFTHYTNTPVLYSAILYDL